MLNLLISVVTVIAVLLFFIGMKNGILIGSGLVFSIFGTLIYMYGTGIALQRMSLAAIAAGADGLIIEVHNNPPKALCDGAQSLTPDQYAQLVGKISALAPIVERCL